MRAYAFGGHASHTNVTVVTNAHGLIHMSIGHGSGECHTRQAMPCHIGSVLGLNVVFMLCECEKLTR